MKAALPLRRGIRRMLWISVSLVGALCAPAIAGRSTAARFNHSLPQDRVVQKKAKEALGRVPLYFEANVGQADPAVQIVSRGGGFLSLLTGSQTYFVNTATTTPIGLQFLGGSEGKATLEEELPGVSHYFLGKDPAKWRTGVRHYAKVRFANVYPGIDILFYSSEQRLEYDFIVAPGADPSVIQMAWSGVEATRIDESGDLVVSTSAGNIRQKRPLVYQEMGRKRVAVEARYRKQADHSYTVEMGSWDRQTALVVDPSLSYSTFLGGSVLEEAYALVIDAGTAIVGGYTESANFPTAPTSLSIKGFLADAFLTRLDSEGTGLVFTVFLGGEARDVITGVAADKEGNFYITGYTESFAFPTTANVYQPFAFGQQDAFVAKISPSGSQLLYSTFFGAEGAESPSSIVVDGLGNATIGGTTSSLALPTTVGAYDQTGNGMGDGFVARFSATGRELVFCTYLGGSGSDVLWSMVADPAGELYLGGTTRSTDFPTTAGAYQRILSGISDAFVCKMSQTGKKVSFCSLFGGTGADEGTAVAFESGGRVVLGGYASTGTFPATANALRSVISGNSDAFIARFNSNGTKVIAATLLGGAAEEILAAALSINGGYMVAGGTTTSLNYPSTGDAIQFSTTPLGDGYVTVLTPLANALLFSSIIGGSNIDQVRALAKGAFSDLFLAGASNSTDIVTTAGAFDRTLNGSADVFVTHIAGVTTQECISSVTATGTTYNADGGGGGVGVGSGCTWYAFSSAPWLTFTGTPQVLSPVAGSLNYSVARNESPDPRTGAIYAAGNLVQILQKGTSNVAPFADVPGNDIFADYVRIVKTNAITTGCGGANYCPSGTTTRGQMAVFIVRSLLGTDDFTVRQDPYFSDVPATHPLFKWIQKLRELNITTGCTLIAYCPEDPVTRGQMAVFLVRSKYGDEFGFSNTPYFADVGSGQPFFSYIQKLRQLGITAGCTANNYCPNDTNTRAQMAVFLTRMFFTPW